MNGKITSVEKLIAVGLQRKSELRKYFGVKQKKNG